MFHCRFRLGAQELELAEVTPCEIVVRRAGDLFASFLEKWRDPRPSAKPRAIVMTETTPEPINHTAPINKVVPFRPPRAMARNQRYKK